MNYKDLQFEEFEKLIERKKKEDPCPSASRQVFSQ